MKKEEEMQKEMGKFICKNEINDFKNQVLIILARYYVECNEDGSYSYDPQANQLIDILREEINKL